MKAWLSTRHALHASGETNFGRPLRGNPCWWNKYNHKEKAVTAWKRQTRRKHNNYPWSPRPLTIQKISENVHMCQKNLVPETASVARSPVFWGRAWRCEQAAAYSKGYKCQRTRNRIIQSTCCHWFVFTLPEEASRYSRRKVETTPIDPRAAPSYSPISTMYTGFWLLPHSDPSLDRRAGKAKAARWKQQRGGQHGTWPNKPSRIRRFAQLRAEKKWLARSDNAERGAKATNACHYHACTLPRTAWLLLKIFTTCASYPS